MGAKNKNTKIDTSAGKDKLGKEVMAAMPPEGEWKADFEAMLGELGLPNEKLQAMRDLPAEKKWVMLSRNKKREEEKNIENADVEPVSPGQVRVAKKSKLQEELDGIVSAVDSKTLSKGIQSLEISMRTEQLSYVKDFLDKQGLEVVVNVMKKSCIKRIPSSEDLPVIQNCIRFLKACMNNSIGLKAVLQQPDSIYLLALAYDCEEIAAKNIVLNLLAALCFVPNGLNQVFDAMTKAQRTKRDSFRFLNIMEDLVNRNLDVEFQKAAVTFMNAAINNVEDNLSRLGVRFEFLDLGITNALISMKKMDDKELKTQLDIYYEEQQRDIVFFKDMQDIVQIDISDPDDLFQELKKMNSDYFTYTWLQKTLKHLLMLPTDVPRRAKLFRIINDVLKQIIYEPYPQVDSPNVIELKSVFDALVKQEEYEQALQESAAFKKHIDVQQQSIVQIEQLLQNKMDEMKKIQIESESFKSQLQSILNEKLQELEVVKEEQKTMTIKHGASLSEIEKSLRNERKQSSDLISAMKDNKESKIGQIIVQLKKDLEVLEDKNRDLQNKLEAAPTQSITNLVINQIPGVEQFDAGKKSEFVSFFKQYGIVIGESTAARETTLAPVQEVNSNAPPPPPMMGGGPPPPPMMGGPPPPGAPAMGGPSLGLPPKKKITPKTKLKPLQWNKINNNSVMKTFWKNITPDSEDAIRKNKMNLDELEGLFAAKAPKVDMAAVTTKAPPVGGVGLMIPAKAKGITLLDSKKSYNIGIILARIKMPNPEITSSIIKLQEEKLTEQLINQFLSSIPTQEESDPFLEYVNCPVEERQAKISELDKAEQFVCALLLVPRCEQRLKCLLFKAKMMEKIEDAKPQIELIYKNCLLITQSKKLRRIFEIVLAIGNYLNADSTKGGAYGFSIDLLPKLANIKSIQPNVSMMNYLVYIVQKSFPEADGFETEFPELERAAKGKF